MSDLTNPLFDDEKEFLERKKLEYERALVADVENLKEQSVHIGKIVAVGAGAVAGVWLLSKIFGGSKKSKSAGADLRNGSSAARKNQQKSRAAAAREEGKDTFDSNAEFYTDGLGGRHRSVPFHKSAAQSAAVFQDHAYAGTDEDFEALPYAFGHRTPADDARTDDGGFGGGFGPDNPGDDPDLIGAEVFANAYVAANVARSRPADDKPQAAAGTRSASAAAHAHKQPEAYIPSHEELFAADARAASSAADTDPFAESDQQLAAAQGQRSFVSQSARARYSRDFITSVASNFLQSEAGRVLMAQAGAVALALATKQLSKWFPGQPEADTAAAAVPPTETNAATAKNADLAAASAVAPSPVAPRFPEPAASSDDPLTPSQPLA